MYLVLFQTYKQHLIKPPSTYVTKSWLFHWKSYIYVFNKLWLKLPKCLQYQWREEEEHCFRRFHTAKVLMNKFLFIYFYLSYLPLLNFWTRICCQKKYAVFWPPSSFVKKKYLGSYSSRINNNFTKILILVYIKKVFQFWWQWSRLQEKLVVQFYDIHLKSKINLINL